MSAHDARSMMYPLNVRGCTMEHASCTLTRWVEERQWPRKRTSMSTSIYFITSAVRVMNGSVPFYTRGQDTPIILFLMDTHCKVKILLTTGTPQTLSPRPNFLGGWSNTNPSYALLQSELARNCTWVLNLINGMLDGLGLELEWCGIGQRSPALPRLY